MSWSRRAPRRARMRWALAVLACLLTGACGFTLRGTQQLPYPTIALNFPANSPLGVELARYIRTGTSTTVVEPFASPAAVFDLISETQEEAPLTINAQGRAIEFTLRNRVRFRLRDAQGREVIEPTELLVHRDISFNDSQRLSKESEKVLLQRDMQSDLVQQILRRLAAARPYAAAD